MNEQQNNSVKTEVLKAIETGQVKMRPRWQFILRASVLAVGVVLVTLTALYLESFVVFMLRETGVLFAPNFGAAGVGEFLFSLPWVLIALALIFIVLLEVLIRRYSFAYGRPLFYSALGVIILVLAGGVAIGFTPLHQSLFEQAEHGFLPFARPMYEHYDMPSQNITVGKISQLNNFGFFMLDRHGVDAKRIQVFITSKTQIPSGTTFMVGDLVVVFGQRDNNGIQAVGIQKTTQFLPPPPRPDDD